MSTAAVTGRMHPPRAVWLRTSLLLLLVIALVLTLISFLNYSNYRKNFYEQNSARYLVLAHDLRQSIEAGLNLGLAPSANTRLHAMMQEAMRQQEGARFIAVIDDSGALLAEGEVDKNALPQWRARLQQSDSHWQQAHPDYLELGMPFVNSFNLKSGAVLIACQRAPIEQAMADMRRRLLLDALQALALAAICTLAGVYWLMRPLQQQLQQLRGVIDGVLHAPEPPLVPAQLLDAQAEQDLQQFSNVAHRVLQQLPAVPPLPQDSGGKA